MFIWKYRLFLFFTECSCKASQIGVDKPQPTCDVNGECQCPDEYEWEPRLGYCKKSGKTRNLIRGEYFINITNKNLEYPALWWLNYFRMFFSVSYENFQNLRTICALNSPASAEILTCSYMQFYHCDRVLSR